MTRQSETQSIDMVEDALEAFEGPRTLMIFAYLLMFTVVLLVLGTILAVFYEITFLQTITQWFADNPMTLLSIAGVISLGVLLVKSLQFVSQFRQKPVKIF